MDRAGNRRQLLALLGTAGAATLLRGIPAPAQDKPACVVRPQQMEGPYFVDTGLNRSDIRSDPATSAVKPGVPLQLTFRVSRVDGGVCAPLPNAHIELWQCDALGVYSGVRDPSGDTTGQKFLRGYQLSDTAGTARFTTIYPGWYPGRTVHLHFTIRAGRSSNRRDEFTSQLYFDDALSDRVFANAPYASRGQRSVKNAGDGIFRGGGSQLLLAVQERGGLLIATFDVGMQS
jgi:protocatechuate 3,4-dioxygenase beta subunit